MKMWAVGENSRLTIGGQGYQFFANNPQGTYNHPNDADTELVGAVIKGGIQTTGWYAGPNDTSGAAKGPQLQAFFITSLRYFQPVACLMPLPISASDFTVVMPAASSAANFSAAVPLPPAMMEPA